MAVLFPPALLIFFISLNPEPSQEPQNDYEDDVTLYRNLAISRLVKKAMAAEPSIELAGRSGSKTPQLSALWKTRVG